MYHPFHTTPTEVRCPEDEPARFRLYRVLDFVTSPRLFVRPRGVPTRTRRIPRPVARGGSSKSLHKWIGPLCSRRLASRTRRQLVADSRDTTSATRRQHRLFSR